MRFTALLFLTFASVRGETDLLARLQPEQVAAIQTTNARVFRENGTMIFPGEDTTIYDTRYVTDANGNLTISDVGNGTKEIVLYAKGFDPTWDTTITPVSGYQMVRVVTSIGQSKDVNVTIPVSE
jgi:hypothetical protein